MSSDDLDLSRVGRVRQNYVSSNAVIPKFIATCSTVFVHVLTSKLISHVENVLLIVGSTKCIPNRNVCYCTGCRFRNRKSNSVSGVGASEGVDDSVSVEDRHGNGPLERVTQGDHLPTNEDGGSR